MKKLKLMALAFFGLLIGCVIAMTGSVSSQDRKVPTSPSDVFAGDRVPQDRHGNAVAATEAPTGFDGLTNGFVDQAAFDEAKDVFEETEGFTDGLGPVYNAASCVSCHQSPVTGAASQVNELRAGHFDGTNFIDHPGGSLIDDRAVDPKIQELLFAGNEVRAFRASLSVLGDGFVEAIDSNTLLSMANAQPGQSGGRIAGQFIQVPVLEADGAVRGGRFGWKNQNSSLESFSADAYLNEMGITSPLLPTENTSNGRVVQGTAFDGKADPEDDGEDIELFTNFMRASKAPPKDAQLAATADARAGSTLFNQIGCAICHTPTIQTAPVGTVINQGTFTVPAALGDKIIHPFGDFLLHDVGTGDGIVQNGGQSTRNKVRTAPLWGVRARVRLMHDGLNVSRTDAILRHAGEATFVINNFRGLSNTQRNQIVAFLNSL